MITLHHLENSRSFRIAWLLEELNLEYKIKEYKRDRLTMLAPKELKNIHPIGKAPIITDDNGAFSESAAIIEYLLDQYNGDQLIPNRENALAFRQYRFFMHYAEGSVMPILVMALVFNKIEKTKVPFFIKPIINSLVKMVRSTYINPTITTHFQYIESILKENKWLTGDQFTAADIHMSFPILAAACRQKEVSSRPNIKRFIKQIEERPAYKKAVEKTGKLDL